MRIVAGTFQAQRIQVLLNGSPIGTLDSRVDWEPATYEFEIDRSMLDATELGRPPSAVLEIQFLAPTALSPASLTPDGFGDERVLALCLRRITFSSV
jgi:hypothetical protein